MNDPLMYLAVLAVPVAIFLGTGLLAVRKGYSFFPWVFAFGLLGLIVLTFLPMANDPQVSQAEQRERAEKGDRIGRGLAGVLVAAVLFRILAATP
jgi:hypothetical protein